VYPVEPPQKDLTGYVVVADPPAKRRGPIAPGIRLIAQHRWENNGRLGPRIQEEPNEPTPAKQAAARRRL
jgi:hypothetical protein